MKHLIIIILSLLYVSSSYTQNKQLLYGFQDVPQSIILNPAQKLDNDWYFGIPMLSHIHAQVGASGVSAYDLFKNDGQDFSTKLRNVLYSMNHRDFFLANQQLDLFSGGFAVGGFEKKDYISFGMYQELDAIIYYPKDLVILAYEGNANNNINRVFDLSHLNLSAEALTVFHVGFSKQVNTNFRFGVRGKIYSGIANVRSTNNQGSFTTVQGNNNVYNHIFNLNLAVQSSGIASLINDENSEISNDISTLRKRAFLGGNLGLGVDFGISYNINKQWTLDASVNDIGYTRNSKDVESYLVRDNYQFEGLEVLFPNNQTTQTTQDNWNEIEDAFEDLFTGDTLKNSYTTWRPIKFNAAISYKFKNSKNNDCDCAADDNSYANKVGLQVFAVKRPKHLQKAVTLFYDKRFFKELNTRLSYSINDFSYTNLGFGLSAKVKGFQMYLMADNLLSLQNIAKSQSVSLQLGFNYIFKHDYKK